MDPYLTVSLLLNLAFGSTLFFYFATPDGD
jgi:hypothetical protein